MIRSLDRIIVLLVGGSSADRRTFRRVVAESEATVDVDETSDLDDAAPHLEGDRDHDCIVVTGGRDGSRPERLVTGLREAGIRQPILLIADEVGEATAAALRAGASDYLETSRLTPERLTRRLAALARMWRAEQRSCRAFAQLSAERQLLERILRQLPSGLVLADAESGDVVFHNERVEGLLGADEVEPEEASGPSGHGSGARWAWPLRRTLESGDAVVDEEIEIGGASHPDAVLRASSSAVRGPGGDVVAAVMTVDDITGLRREQDELRSEARLIETLYRIGGRLTSQLNSADLIEEITQEATALTDAEFGVFYYHTLGADGSHHLRLRKTEAREQDVEPAEDVMITPEIATALWSEGVVRLPDIRERPDIDDELRAALGRLRSVLAVPVRSSSGALIGALFFGHSQIGAFTRRAERLVAGIASWASVALDNARLYEELQSSVRAREQVMSIVSHDLRNPLNAVSMAVEELQGSDLDPDEQQRYVDAVRRAVGRCNTLIRDLLDVGRIEQGALVVEPHPFNLERLLEECRAGHEVQARSRGVLLQVEVDRDVKTVNADRRRIHQVLGNLVSNALKYSARGGTVTLRAAPAGNDDVFVAVEDDGRGIDPELLPHIFDRYWQVQASGRSGAGLGLAIARGIVEAHGRSISVDSEPGRGTVFSFALPAPDTRS